MDPTWVASWIQSARTPRVTDAIQAMIREADQTVRTRRPICLSNGNCCNFERQGHALWLTGLETAWCLNQIGCTPSVEQVEQSLRRGDCPFLKEGACGVHWARPLGCRAYFCDGAGQGWQEAMLEAWHGNMKTLHNQLDIPYLYDEWRRLLLVFAAEGVR